MAFSEFLLHSFIIFNKNYIFWLHQLQCLAFMVPDGQKWEAVNVPCDLDILADVE
jgi:hypothetical protein